MAFWIGLAVAAVAAVINFFWIQKTLRIRLALLIFALIGVGVAADRYFADQKKQQQTLEYWEVSRLNVFGLHFVGGDLVDHTAINNIIGPFIHNQNGKAVWDCTPSSVEAYTRAVTLDPKFPFSYFYRATCNRLSNSGEWQRDADTAQTILRITTQIPGHNQNHDEILRMLDHGDFGRKSG